MNRHARIRKMRCRTSQPRKEHGVFCHVDRKRVLCIPPSTPSPGSRSFAWQDSGNNADHRRAWFTLSLLLQPDTWQTTEHGSTVVRLQGRPYIAAHQQGVSIDRQFSRIFPAHLRSLARCFSRARRELRALCFALASALRVSVSRKSFVQRTRKTFSRPSEKAPLALGSGAHSRRFAQECPGGNPGKYKTGEMTWHSTKTKSL